MTLPDLKEIESLPAENIPAILAGLAAIQSALAARLMTFSNGSTPAQTSEDHLLTVAEAAEKLSASKDWLYRQANNLQFTVRIGSRLRFSSSGIDKYIQQRKGRR